MEWAKEYNACADTFFKTDSCHIVCSDKVKQERGACSDTYGYHTGSEYDTCSKAAEDGYATCIKSCPSSSTACDYVYGERKSMSSQIDNLCK